MLLSSALMSDALLQLISDRSEGIPSAFNLVFQGGDDLPFFLDQKKHRLPEVFSLVEEGVLSKGDLKSKLIFDDSPWWQRKDIPQGGWIYLSSCDEKGSLNGPLATGWGDQVISFLPGGVRGTIESPFPIHSEVSSHTFKSLWNMRVVGVEKLRRHLKIENTARNLIELNSFNGAEGAMVVYLRMAFPEAYLELKELPVDKDLTPLWKRLCQNLGVRCGKAPRMTEQEPVSIPNELSRLFQNPEEIIRDINRDATIIPDRLLRLWLIP